MKFIWPTSRSLSLLWKALTSTNLHHATRINRVFSSNKLVIKIKMWLIRLVVCVWQRFIGLSLYKFLSYHSSVKNFMTFRTTFYSNFIASFIHISLQKQFSLLCSPSSSCKKLYTQNIKCFMYKCTTTLTCRIIFLCKTLKRKQVNT